MVALSFVPGVLGLPQELERHVVLVYLRLKQPSVGNSDGWGDYAVEAWPMEMEIDVRDRAEEERS